MVALPQTALTLLVLLLGVTAARFPSRPFQSVPGSICASSVSTAAELDSALNCLNSEAAGAHELSLAADITLDADLPVIANPALRSLSIDGAGHEINANGHGRVLGFADFAEVTVRELTIRNSVSSYEHPGGALDYECSEEARVPCEMLLDRVSLVNNRAVHGGALLVGGATVTIRDSEIAQNHAENGGAIATAGGTWVRLTMLNSAIYSNTASVDGGGIYFGSTSLPHEFVLINVTISGNSAAQRGGGILADEVEGDSLSIYMAHTTVTLNRAAQGAGLYLGDDEADYDRRPLLTMVNSVVADNIGAAECAFRHPRDNPNRQLLRSAGHNLDGDGSCLSLTRTQGDVLARRPWFGPLGYHGGPSPTHVPLFGGPLIAAADRNTCALVPLDQRGYRRNWLTACDIGAVEFRYTDFLADPRTVTHAWLSLLHR
jgi:predicted outer membrane repeat protein